jgi:hypothetical protein
MTDKHIPAFPCHPNTVVSLYVGMTLRDYFAAKAMQGILANTGVETIESLLALDAKRAYAMADAMLEARNGTY